MSGIMSQIILIQPTMERVALSHENPPPRRLTAPQLLQDTESSWKDMKKISNVGTVTRNTKNTNQTYSRPDPLFNLEWATFNPRSCLQFNLQS